jgi:hypothetical protein
MGTCCFLLLVYGNDDTLVLQTSFVKAGLFFPARYIASIMIVEDAGYLRGHDFVIFFF